ncbi:calcium-binding protein [Cypionkella sinensis]|uniref:Calcium-binding protein n=1 Tax=Cypionkella sinensis TaxID=1756043 RepID=A0ABV7J0J6_9RHOB
MDLLILGSLLLTGGLLALAGVFDGGDDKDDDKPDEPQRGTEGDDTLAGDHGIFHGLRGDDQITVSGDAEGHGDKGDDRLTVSDTATGFGGEGQDTITASGESTVHGGSGRDLIFASDEVIADGGSGGDSISIRDAAVGYGGSGQDSLYMEGNSTIYGGDDADNLDVRGNGTAYGDAGDDDLRGFGASHLYGGEGNDRLDDFGHASTLSGGAGDDLIRTSSGLADAGAGNDVLEINWAPNHFTGAGVARAELSVTGGEGGDTFLAHADYARDDETFIINDFDPMQDHLSLGITEAQQAHATITTTAFATYTEVTVTLPDMQVLVAGNTLQTVPQVLHLRLNGVTDPSLVRYDIQTSPDRSP